MSSDCIPRANACLGGSEAGRITSGYVTSSPCLSTLRPSVVGFSVLLVLMSCGVGAAQSPSLSQAKRSFRGVPVASPLRIDGRLEEEFYRTVAPMSDFVQIEPVDGAVATEKTDVWVAFDDTQIYIAFQIGRAHV